MIYSREVIYFSKVRNSETLLRLLVVSLMLYMLVSFGAARWRLNEARAEEQRLDALCAERRAENEELRAHLAASHEDETLEAMARDQLGLVKPGERIYYFN